MLTQALTFDASQLKKFLVHICRITWVCLFSYCLPSLILILSDGLFLFTAFHMIQMATTKVPEVRDITRIERIGRNAYLLLNKHYVILGVLPTLYVVSKGRFSEGCD